MATTLLTIAPQVLPAGTTSRQFTMPTLADNEVVVVFTVQAPDVSDTTKTLSAQLIDITNNNLLLAAITGWQGGSLDKHNNPAIPAFGVSGVPELAGHTLQLSVTVNSTLNTGITVSTQ